MKHFAAVCVWNDMQATLLRFIAFCVLAAAMMCRAAESREIRLTVDGVERTALVYAPAAAKSQASPLVFVFHGHGGSSQQAERSFHLEKEWPEAIVVYPQGLKTPGQLTDPDGKRNGWQGLAGDQGDRDLEFFDALLARLKQDYQVDAKRIYSTGHSNGGGFTYLLWLERGDVFAAVAPSSAVGKFALKLKPKPVMHIAGQSDPLVKFAWQEKMIDAVRKVNHCESTGTNWAGKGTLYPSKEGTPVVTLIHPGGHTFDPDAPALIVKFFKEHAGS